MSEPEQLALLTADLAPAQIEGLVADAQGAGFLPDAIPLDRLFSGKP